MTDYERIVQQFTTTTTVATLSRTTEQMAEKLAQEFIKDPATRARLSALVEEFFADTMRQLHQRRSERMTVARKRTRKQRKQKKAEQHEPA